MVDRLSQRVAPRPLIGVGDLLTGVRRAWYIPNEIPVGLTVLLGSKGVGKSTLAIDYAFRIARDFPVVLLGGDGADFYANLAEAWTTYYQKGTTQLNFDFAPLALLDEEQRSGFINNVSLFMPRLIIIDPISSFLPGDLDNREDIDILIDACEDLRRQTGASVLLVAHTDNLSLIARDYLIQRSDVALYMDNAEPYQSALSVLKTPTPEPSLPRFVNIERIELDEERATYIARRSKRLYRPANLDGKQIRILRELVEAEADGGLETEELAARTGITTASVYRAANKLKAAYLAHQQSHGKAWNVTPQGKMTLAQANNDQD